ncbi:MAG: hypothetical protein AAF489_02905 [Bacteroidota bacterium]
MKKLKNVNGAQELSKNEQKSISGGGIEPCQGQNWIYIPIDPPNNNEAYCLGLPANTEWVSGKCYYCY